MTDDLDGIRAEIDKFRQDIRRALVIQGALIVISIVALVELLPGSS